MVGCAVRTEARFPGVPANAGHYESFYIKAAQPGGGRAIWIRHTIHQRPGRAEPTASLWFTFFDADAPGPRATKQTVAARRAVGPGRRLHPGRRRGARAGRRATGAAASEALTASWDLRFSDEAEPLHHLPYDVMYRTKLPKTKFLSPYPDADVHRQRDDRRRGDRDRRLAGDDRPQLGRRARRALDLDPGPGPRRQRRRLSRHRGGPDQDRPRDDPLGRQRPDRDRRRGAPRRRLPRHLRHRDRGVARRACEFTIPGKDST